MAFCLLPDKINEFKKALKEKEIKMADLLNMTSEERTALFEKYAGADAKKVNTFFEEKLVLKNRIQGLKNWASKVAEVGKYSEAGKEKLAQKISEYRAAQQERMFNPKENEAFLSDLVEEEIGSKISRGEAKKVFELSSKVDDLKKNFDGEKWSSDKAKNDYGAAKVIYEKYVESLKNPDLTLKEVIQEYGQEIGEIWKTNKAKAITQVITDIISKLSDITVSFVASIDNSFVGRQGSITLTKSPKIWWNMFKNSFVDFAKTLKGENPMDILLADRFSRPNDINGLYEKAKLFPKTEEQFPTSLPEKIPVIGRAFKASEFAFKGSAMRARMDLFDMMANVYKAKGIELNDTLVKDMGNVVNTITARGKLGAIGSSKPVQLLMWAPKMLKADWDILTAHTFGAGLETKIARMEAAKTTFGVVVATAAVAAIAVALGADVETDPRSSEFLKIRIGNTTFNPPFARGIPQIVTLMARLITQSSKDSRTGIITKLNSGEFSSKTMFDVGLDFLVNKTTPFTRASISVARGRDISGKKPTLGSIAFGLTPISVQNFIGLKDETTTQSVVGAFTDLIGIGSNTYQRESDWSQNTSKELVQFKEKVGEETFKQANDSYNQQFNDWQSLMKDNKQFQNLSDEDKQKAITKKKSEIKDNIFKQYGFKYQQTKKIIPSKKIKWQ